MRQLRLIKETASVQRRIDSMRKLVEEYYPLEDRCLIERHSELLRFFDVRGSMHKKHPHRMKRVYISRRALKHVLEKRKSELKKNHSDEEARKSIFFLIEKAQEVILNYDIYTHEPPKHIYLKAYAHLGEPFVRIVIDEVEDRLEIKSIHFSKNRKL